MRVEGKLAESSPKMLRNARQLSLMNSLRLSPTVLIEWIIQGPLTNCSHSSSIIRYDVYTLIV